MSLMHNIGRFSTDDILPRSMIRQPIYLIGCRSHTKSETEIKKGSVILNHIPRLQDHKEKAFNESTTNMVTNLYS